jgi:hypothetical protein
VRFWISWAERDLPGADLVHFDCVGAQSAPSARRSAWRERAPPIVDEPVND